MQATADAQGDFARTSGDSFANMKRQLQTNLASIEASIGSLLIGPVSEATSVINNFLNSLIGEEKKPTILDQISGIKIDSESKIAEIDAIAAKAEALVLELENINNGGVTSENSTLIDYIEQLTGDIGGLDTALTDNTIGENAEKLAGELNPTVEGTIADTVKGMREDLDEEGKKIDDSDIPENVKEIADGLNPPVEEHIGATLEEVTGDISEFTQILENNGVESAMTGLVKDLDPTVEKTVSEPIGEIESDIEGLESKLADNDIESGMSSLAEGLNPEVDDTFGQTVGVIADNIGKLTEKTNNAANVVSTLGGIANNANALNASSPQIRGSLLSALQTINGLENLFKQGAGQNVEDLANALSGNAPDTSKADAWKKFLDALGTNAGALSTLTGASAEETAKWLNAMKEAASGLDEGDAAAWNLLLSNFVTGLPALKDTEGGKAFFDAMAANFLAMGNESEEARSGLAALGYESDDIATAQDRWLKICQELVKTIPELSSIINTQTGEIDGGTQAVKDYIEAWQNDKILQIRIDSLKRQKAALEEALNYDWDLELRNKRANLYTALRQAGASKETAEAIINMGRSGGGYGVTEGKTYYYNGVNGGNEFSTKGGAVYDALKEVYATEQAYALAKEATAYAVEDITAQIAELTEETGKSEEALFGMADAADESAKNLSLLERAAKGDEDAMQAVTDAVNSASQALEALADYQERVRNETEQAVRGVINGFSSIETPMQKARKQVDDLKKQMDGLTDEKEIHEFEIRISDAEGSMPTIQSMTAGLKSQLEYMQEYQRMLTEARAKGVSEDILATLSDGSQESYDYLYALTQYGGNIEELNQAYKDVQDEAEKFTNTLTNQKLTADEAYQSLVETAQNAIDSLNMGDQAYASVEATVQAIVNALGDKAGDVKTQVDNILAQIARLSTASGGGGFFSSGFGAMLSGMRIYQPHANGIDNVPFDGYLALLHQGERVQTAAEADLSRRYSYQQPSFDYDAMGGAIGANMPRGNVYLDGQTVGRVISDRQANSYRALERSGWQG